MDLLALSPEETAQCFLKHPTTGENILTDKKKPMFVEIYHKEGKKFQALNIARARKNMAIFEKYKGSDEVSLSDDDQTAMVKNDTDLMIGMTKSLLIQIGKKEVTDAAEFYNNAALEVFRMQVEAFLGNTGNFLKA